MGDSFGVEVLLFGRLREATRQRSLHVDAPADATPAALWEQLVCMHPALGDGAGGVRAAVNEVYREWDARLQPGDVVAFIPPVAGGAAAGGGVSAVHVAITDGALDARRLEARVRGDGDGAVCTFSGTVRNNHQGRAVERLEYEAYAAMAQAEMRRIGEEALQRSGASAIALWHRVGGLEVGEASVVVSAAAPHRAEAFEACRYAIDELKMRAPIFKKEHGPTGDVWVENAASGA